MGPTPLWVAIRFPALALEVFSRARPQDDARPFVVDSGGRVPRLVAVHEAARQAGLREGMLLSAAYPLAPDLVRQPRDLAAEEAALEQLATHVLAFTPMVSLEAPEALVASIGSTLRLFGGREALLEAITARLTTTGFTACFGIAPTPLAALALADAGIDELVVSPEALERALAPLALRHFGLDPESLATLSSAGIRSFGDARKLPRSGLARRLGPALVALFDRCLGRSDDPRLPFLPPPRFASRLELPSAVETVEALSFALQRLVGDLAGWLEARGLGVRVMELALCHEHALVRRLDSPLTEARFALAAPSRTPRHLMHVLRERLSRIELPAPVAALALASEEVAPLAGCNLELLRGEGQALPEVPLLDRLRARLGEDAVRRIAVHAEHRPEHAMRVHDPATVPPLVAPPPLAPRPFWLFREAQPLAALMEAQPWILREGPERIESGWWDGSDVRRDYYVAESPQGETAWIYRDHRYASDDGDWFLHGLFA